MDRTGKILVAVALVGLAVAVVNLYVVRNQAISLEQANEVLFNDASDVEFALLGGPGSIGCTAFGSDWGSSIAASGWDRLCDTTGAPRTIRLQSMIIAGAALALLGFAALRSRLQPDKTRRIEATSG
jgi:hypothetical protein